jgi:hypothetical protein
MSVDPPDGHSDAVAENLSFNEMESIVEILLENVLDIKGAISEQDESDDTGTELFKLPIILYLNNSSFCNNVKYFDSSNKAYASFLVKFYFCSNDEVVSPPPEC